MWHPPVIEAVLTFSLLKIEFSFFFALSFSFQFFRPRLFFFSPSDSKFEFLQLCVKYCHVSFEHEKCARTTHPVTGASVRFTLKINATRSSETSERTYKAIRPYNPKNTANFAARTSNVTDLILLFESTFAKYKSRNDYEAHFVSGGFICLLFWD